MTLHWAVHRLNGVSSPANAAYSVDELKNQVKNSGATCLFTVLPLLQTSLKAASAVGIPENRIFVCEMAGDNNSYPNIKRLSQLIDHGSTLPVLEPPNWKRGQGKAQIAFLCYSSGTSGLPVRNPTIRVYRKCIRY
jgi:long-subunit acyl-CoA synthetase (AMP-forming)